jgi:hypothetical protein
MTPRTLSAARTHPELQRSAERREIQEMRIRNFGKSIIRQILKVSQQFIKGASDRQNQTLWLDQHRRLCIDYPLYGVNTPPRTAEALAGAVLVEIKRRHDFGKKIVEAKSISLRIFIR